MVLCKESVGFELGAGQPGGVQSGDLAPSGCDACCPPLLLPEVDWGDAHQPCLPQLAQQAGAQAPCPDLQTICGICPACRCLGSSSATLWCSFSSSRRGQLSNSGSGLTLRITAASAWGTPCSQQGMSLANTAVVGPLRCAGSGRTLTAHAPAGQGRGAGKGSQQWQHGAYVRARNAGPWCRQCQLAVVAP